MQKVIYTDMDGTILDHYNYSYEKSKEGLEILKKKNIPIILCSSKTKSEIVYWKKILDINHPFISENGGGIFIPKKYFNFNFSFNKIIDGYYSIILGANYNKLILAIKELKNEFEINSFIDMNPKEIALISNFSIEDAKRAQNRDFEIPFILKDKSQEKKLVDKIKDLGFNCLIGGRYYHILGKNSKGKAVKILNDLFSKKYGNIFTYGFGDSFNDFSMLDVVDEPYLVKNKNGEYVSKKYNFAPDIGPAGWNKIIIDKFKN